nr:1479_t:CDS:2 [Entrophospora candida]
MNGRNDVNNNNSSTQVLDSSRLYQDSGGSDVKQFGAINDVNTSLKNIAAPIQPISTNCLDKPATTSTSTINSIHAINSTTNGCTHQYQLQEL